MSPTPLSHACHETCALDGPLLAHPHTRLLPKHDSDVYGNPTAQQENTSISISQEKKVGYTVFHTEQSQLYKNRDELMKYLDGKQ